MTDKTYPTWLKRIGDVELKVFEPAKTFDHTEFNFKNTLLVNYTIPARTDMLVIIPFFNPCNSMRMLQNLLLVKQKLANANIPHCVIHCLFPNSHKIMQPSTSYITVTSNSYGFFKENLANVIISKQIETYNKFLILDGDIIFQRPQWYDEASEYLDTYDIIQPYTTYSMLTPNFITSSTSPHGQSCFSLRQSHSQSDGAICGHPGYVIAFTRDFWLKHHYPDVSLLGGGDKTICTYVINASNLSYASMPGEVYHLYHNIPRNRQYQSRHLILQKYLHPNTTYNFIHEIIYKNKHGVYEWIDEIKQDINVDILNYFTSRRDDDLLLA